MRNRLRFYFSLLLPRLRFFLPQIRGTKADARVCFVAVRTEEDLAHGCADPGGEFLFAEFAYANVPPGNTLRAIKTFADIALQAAQTASAITAAFMTTGEAEEFSTRRAGQKLLRVLTTLILAATIMFSTSGAARAPDRLAQAAI